MTKGSDEGLTLETSAFQSLYGGQFTLSTLLINQIFVLGKTVPEVLDTARGRRPRAVLKTEGTAFFPNTDRPRLVNIIFIFFSSTQGKACARPEHFRAVIMARFARN